MTTVNNPGGPIGGAGESPQFIGNFIKHKIFSLLLAIVHANKPYRPDAGGTPH